MKLVCLVFKKYFKEIHVGFIFLKDHVTIPYGDSIACAQRIFFEILLDQNEIRLYLPFSDWFGIANGRPFSVPNRLENGKYNLMSAWFNKISKIFLCVHLRVLYRLSAWWGFNWGSPLYPSVSCYRYLEGGGGGEGFQEVLYSELTLHDTDRHQPLGLLYTRSV